MAKRTWCFGAAALFLSVALAAFVSPFASTAPDGLDKFAGEQHFEGRAEDQGSWTHAPLAGYKAPGVRGAAISTGLAGAAGTLLVFVCGWGMSKAVARRRMKPQMNADNRR